MTPVQTNKPVFFDDEGNVLEGGTIYVGQPNTDPRTNPKTVTFRDSGGSEFTAPKKIQTVAGRIAYNGKPIVALVDGEYSMLVLDAGGKELDYYRSISPSDSGSGGIADFSEVTRVGLTLSEVKAFDVSVGDVVENVGKTTATDGLGEEWLAVGATGSPGDDVDLIDFDNGLQGQRVENGPQYQEEVIELGGDFIAGESVKVVRIGSMVTISSTTGPLSHSSGEFAESALGAIPSWARPLDTIYNVYRVLTSIYTVYVDEDGVFRTAYRETASPGTGSTKPNSGYPPTISYNV